MLTVKSLVQSSLDAVTPNGALIRLLKNDLAIERSEPLRAALQACLEACYADDQREINRTLDHLLTHFKPPDNWRELMIADIQKGEITYPMLVEHFDADFAIDAFRQAGVTP